MANVKKHLGIIIILLFILGISVFMLLTSSRDSTLSMDTQHTKEFPPANDSQPKEITPIQDKAIDTVEKEDLIIGKGQEAKTGEMVSVQYRGTLLDGREFDSSYKRNTPFSFTLGSGEVIPGWDMGIPGMRVRGKRKLTIPSSLAYGSAGGPPGSIIGPDATLVFEVTLVSIQK